MEFKIRHTTPFFSLGMILPGVLFIVVLFLYLALGIALTDSLLAMEIFVGVFIFCAAAEILFIVLFLVELACGAKIIIESDHVDIRMLLRRKKIHFYDIEEARYSHNEISQHGRYHSPYRHHTLAGMYGHYYYSRKWRRNKIEAQLDFYLTSGKRITLVDAATGYAAKRDRAKVDPSVDPDENVRLYQAYQCYRSAVDQYAVSHKFQIPR